MSADQPTVDATAVDDVEHGAPEATRAYRIANLVGAGCVLVLGIALAIGGQGLGLGVVGGAPGPGVFPLGIGVLAIVIALAWAVTLRPSAELVRSGDTLPPDRLGVRRIVVTAVATGALLWALGWVGYMIAMTAYVLALLVFVGGRRWWSSAIVAVGFGVGSFALFTFGLGVRLPHAALPFLAALGI